MAKLTYFKMMREDFEVLNEMYSSAQIGELIVATMQYLADGTVMEVDSALKYAFTDYRKKVDRAQKAYDEKCETNSKNGAKGGRTKAERARSAGKECPEKVTADDENAEDIDELPPATLEAEPEPYRLNDATRQATQRIVFKIADASHSATPGTEQIQAFLDHLEADEGTINGEPARSESDMEAAVKAHLFPTYLQEAEVFEYIFSTYKGLRGKDGEERASEAAHMVCENCDFSNSTIQRCVEAGRQSPDVP